MGHIRGQLCRVAKPQNKTNLTFIKNLAEYLPRKRQDECVHKFYLFNDLIGLSPLEEEVRDLEKARTCAFQANYHLIWAVKYRRKVLVGPVEVRLLEVLKMIAENMVICCWLLEFMMVIMCICLFLLHQAYVYLVLFVC